MVLSKSIHMFCKTGLGGLFLFVLTVFAGLMPAAVIAQDQSLDSLDPQALYERMLESNKRYDYKGILTYEQAGQMQSFEVSSRKDGPALDQRLSQLDGPQLEHFLRFDATCSPRQSASIDQFDDYYNLFSAGEVRVAGRVGTEIVLMPVDRYRNGYHFVVDNETGLMLRSVVSAPDRRVIERTQFVSIDFELRDMSEDTSGSAETQDGESDPSADSGDNEETVVEAENVGPRQSVASSEEGEEGEKSRDAPESVSCKYLSIENGWTAAWLPEGFNLLESSLQGERAILVFGDGISVASVFIEPVQETFLPPSNAQRGATAVYINYLSTQTDTYLVSVVGEIPMMTAERIFTSLRRQ